MAVHEEVHDARELVTRKRVRARLYGRNERIAALRQTNGRFRIITEVNIIFVGGLRRSAINELIYAKGIAVGVANLLNGALRRTFGSKLVADLVNILIGAVCLTRLFIPGWEKVSGWAGFD